MFLVLCLWQVPHFLAIAWICRIEYGRAGLCMLPAADPEGKMIDRQMICYGPALIAATLIPLAMSGAGLVYLAGVLLLGNGFLACAVGFARRLPLARARVVLRAPLTYLPVLLTLLLLDKFSH